MQYEKQSRHAQKCSTCAQRTVNNYDYINYIIIVINFAVETTIVHLWCMKSGVE